MKVIKLKIKPLAGNNHINLIHEIIMELAEHLGFKSCDGKLQIRKVRSLIKKQARIAKLNISKKDIERLEYPDKCQIPTNAGKVLEKLAEQMLPFSGNWSYTVKPNTTPSQFLIKYSLDQLAVLCAMLTQPNPSPALILNQTIINQISIEIQQFDNHYSNDANNLL